MRRLAHLLGWHTPACFSDMRCTPPTGGAVVLRPRLGWHRYLAARGARA